MKVKKAYFIGVDNSVRRVPELEGRELSLKAMYWLIGCSTIEHVALKKGVDMWCDEEGLLQTAPILNLLATQLYRDAYPMLDPRELGIVGNVIITDNTKAGDFIH